MSHGSRSVSRRSVPTASLSPANGITGIVFSPHAPAPSGRHALHIIRTESAVAWRPDPSMLSLRLVSPNGPVKSHTTKPFQLHFREQLLTELLHLLLLCHCHLELPQMC